MDDEIRNETSKTTPEVDATPDRPTPSTEYDDLLEEALRRDQLDNISASLSHMRKTGYMTDIVLACGDKLYPAHKVVLSAASLYCRNLFAESREKRPCSRLFDLSHLNSTAVELLLDIIYTGHLGGDVEGDVSLCKAILAGAHLLQLTAVAKYCWEVMMEGLSVSCYLELWNLAEEYENLDMVSDICCFVAANFYQASQSPQFVQLTLAQLKTLLAIRQASLCRPDLQRFLNQYLETHQEKSKLSLSASYTCVADLPETDPTLVLPMLHDQISTQPPESTFQLSSVSSLPETLAGSNNSQMPDRSERYSCRQFLMQRLLSGSRPHLPAYQSSSQPHFAKRQSLQSVQEHYKLQQWYEMVTCTNEEVNHGNEVEPPKAQITRSSMKMTVQLTKANTKSRSILKRARIVPARSECGASTSSIANNSPSYKATAKKTEHLRNSISMPQYVKIKRVYVKKPKHVHQHLAQHNQRNHYVCKHVHKTKKVPRTLPSRTQSRDLVQQEKVAESHGSHKMARKHKHCGCLHHYSKKRSNGRDAGASCSHKCIHQKRRRDNMALRVEGHVVDVNKSDAEKKPRKCREANTRLKPKNGSSVPSNVKVKMPLTSLQLCCDGLLHPNPFAKVSWQKAPIADLTSVPELLHSTKYHNESTHTFDTVCCEPPSYRAGEDPVPMTSFMKEFQAATVNHGFGWKENFKPGQVVHQESIEVFKVPRRSCLKKRRMRRNIKEHPIDKPTSTIRHPDFRPLKYICQNQCTQRVNSIDTVSSYCGEAVPCVDNDTDLNNSGSDESLTHSCRRSNGVRSSMRGSDWWQLNRENMPRGLEKYSLLSQSGYSTRKSDSAQIVRQNIGHKTLSAPVRMAFRSYPKEALLYPQVQSIPCPSETPTADGFMGVATISNPRREAPTACAGVPEPHKPITISLGTNHHIQRCNTAPAMSLQLDEEEKPPLSMKQGKSEAVLNKKGWLAGFVVSCCTVLFPSLKKATSAEVGLSIEDDKKPPKVDSNKPELKPVPLEMSVELGAAPNQDPFIFTSKFH